MSFSVTGLARLHKSRFFRKKYFQEHRTSQPQIAIQTPENLASDPPGVRDPLFCGDLLLAAQEKTCVEPKQKYKYNCLQKCWKLSLLKFWGPRNRAP